MKKEVKVRCAWPIFKISQAAITFLSGICISVGLNILTCWLEVDLKWNHFVSAGLFIVVSALLIAWAEHSGKLSYVFEQTKSELSKLNDNDVNKAWNMALEEEKKERNILITLFFLIIIFTAIALVVLFI